MTQTHGQGFKMPIIAAAAGQCYYTPKISFSRCRAGRRRPSKLPPLCRRPFSCVMATYDSAAAGITGHSPLFTAGLSTSRYHEELPRHRLAGAAAIATAHGTLVETITQRSFFACRPWRLQLYRRRRASPRNAAPPRALAAAETRWAIPRASFASLFLYAYTTRRQSRWPGFIRRATRDDGPLC